MRTTRRLSGQMLVLSLSLALGPGVAGAADRPVVSVWPGVPPGSEDRSGAETVRVTEAGDHVVANVHRPSITVYPPANAGAPAAGVLVIPGGGHRELWMDHEGYDVAQWLSDHGVAAFVLKYRLASQEGSTYTVEGDALADVHRALRLIRSRADESSVDPFRLGVMGFSAGGELAARASMVFDAGDPTAKDPVERQGTKPAFQALVYPGRSHAIVPTPESPPAFLTWGTGDRPDIAEGMAVVYLLFKRSGVPVEMHAYSDAGHGFGVRQSNPGPSRQWIERFHEWLGGRGLLDAPRITTDDMQRLIGVRWEGELTYRNYSDNQLVTIPAALSVSRRDETQYLFSYTYPHEPQANREALLTIKEDGTVFGGETLLSKELLGDGSLRLTTTERGEDAGKEAVFLYTYTIGPNRFSTRSEVTRAGEKESIFRNGYTFESRGTSE